MKEATGIVEYGVPIDARTMIEPPDVAELELEPGHPGLGDEDYVARRRQLFAQCRYHRLNRLGPPVIAYTAEETRIWRAVSSELDRLHCKHASRIYLQGKRDLGISQTEIPQMRHLSEHLTRTTNMHLVPAEGPLPYRTFYSYIAERGFPVTQFIRHGSHPEFTPEPDMIHDCLGHVPGLMNPDYAELLTLIGKAAATTPHPEQVLALKRFSWFSIEFGLIEEAGETRIFGAGILSSTGEIPFSLSTQVEHRPFVTSEVIATDYDPSRMQDLLFVIPSFTFLRREIEQLVKRFGIPVVQLDELSMHAPDTFPLRRIDHVRFFVGNARQSAYFYRNAFGFDVIAYAGLETGLRNEAAYVLRQGHITFVLASPLSADHPENRRLVLHGDGVQDIALEVDDVGHAFHEAVRRGAIAMTEPVLREDEHGVYESAAIRAYGDTTHTFVNRDRYRGVFAPGYKPLDPDRYSPGTFHPVGLKAIDHIVGNVEEGKMNEWVSFYENVLGFNQLVHFDDKDISTEYSALMSKVVQNGTGRIKFPINEPARGRRRSQIEEYLQYYGGAGVQHIAMATGDIIETVRAMRHNDVSFLRVPPAYYDALPQRVGPIKENVATLAELGILVDRDDEGYMLQIFTKPVADRPTLFFEIIQRHGSRSFGKGNFKALFEAIEREQARRGTL